MPNMISNIMPNAKNSSYCAGLSPHLSPPPDSASPSHIADRCLAQHTGEVARQLDKGNGTNIETVD